MIGTTGLLLAAMALQTLPSPALGRWESAGSDSRGESAIDPQSIRRSGDRVTVVVRTRIHRSSTGEPIVGVMRYSFDCRTNMGQVDVADIYRGDGTFVGSSVTEEPDEPIVPGTPNGTALERACRASGQR